MKMQFVFAEFNTFFMLMKFNLFLEVIMLWFGKVVTVVQASILLLVKFKTSWACNTSSSNSIPTSNILMEVERIVNISREIMTIFGAQIRTMIGDSWFP